MADTPGELPKEERDKFVKCVGCEVHSVNHLRSAGLSRDSHVSTIARYMA